MPSPHLSSSVRRQFAAELLWFFLQDQAEIVAEVVSGRQVAIYHGVASMKGGHISSG